jgi:nitrate reductase beta subunit
MARVYNWQLGRDMDYPYEPVRPKRQFAAVFDTNKCIACQTCTMACKTTWTSGRGEEYMWWNNVETKPWGGWPTGWDVNILDRLGPQTWSNGVYKGKTLFEAAPADRAVLGWKPDEQDWSHPNLGEDEVSDPVDLGVHFALPHLQWMFYLPRICNHCSYPGCLASCPRKAIYKRPEDGIVLIDQARCRGYQQCVEGCPYKRPMFRPTTGMSEKCVGCYPLVERGLQPRCVQTCIGKLRMMGFINPPERADPTNPIDYLVHVKKLALPLYPQLGLEPNVYYIPPIHVPYSFTRQMFGPGVERAVEAYKGARNDSELVGAIELFGSAPDIMASFRVSGDEAVGFKEDGKEAVRVPLKEPTVVRPFYDEARKVYRHSIT